MVSRFEDRMHRDLPKIGVLSVFRPSGEYIVGKYICIDTNHCISVQSRHYQTE